MFGYAALIGSLFALSYMENKERMLKLMFLIIIIFSAFRYGIGYDYYSYLTKATSLNVSIDDMELIPRLMLLLSRETIPFLFFFLSSIFISFFYYKGIKCYGINYLPSVIFYVCFPFLFMDQLGIIRQGMAASVVFYAIMLGDDKRILKILLILLAVLCHGSAIAGFLIFIPWEKFTNKQLWPMFAVSFFVGTVVVALVFYLLTVVSLGDTISARAEGYFSEISKGEGNLLQFLIYAIAILCLMYYNQLVEVDPRNSYFIGLVVLGASLYALFSFNDSLAKRFCMFFFSTSIIVVPHIVLVMRIPSRIYYSLCILLFSMLIYVGSHNYREQDQAGYSVTYPYRTIFSFID